MEKLFFLNRNIIILSLLNNHCGVNRPPLITSSLKSLETNIPCRVLNRQNFFLLCGFLFCFSNSRHSSDFFWVLGYLYILVVHWLFIVSVTEHPLTTVVKHQFPSFELYCRFSQPVGFLFLLFILQKRVSVWIRSVTKNSVVKQCNFCKSVNSGSISRNSFVSNQIVQMETLHVPVNDSVLVRTNYPWFVSTNDFILGLLLSIVS